MHDLRAILQDPAPYRRMLHLRRAKDIDLDALLQDGETRRLLIGQIEDGRAAKNAASKQIGALMREGKKDEAETAKEKVAQVSAKLAQWEPELEACEERIQATLMAMPNLLSEEVPEGDDEGANRLESTWGEAPSFDFPPKDHADLGEALGILNFEQGARLAGSRFAVLYGLGARLERALTAFMLDLHTTEYGYTEVLPPFIASRETLTASGQLPKFEEDVFRLSNPDHYFLIPTAEVQLVNLNRGLILTEEQLPLKYVAYTPCFRAEAGSYGRDTRGLIRQHQFDKVELVQLTRPEDSEAAHEQMLDSAREVLRRLELPHRVVTLSSGDTGFAAWKCYDIEVWLPGQNCYREISSVSNVKDFQGRRANIRFRRDDGKPEIIHALNGSGLAVGRTWLALLENHQQADGSVSIPQALRPYLGGLERIEALKA